MRCARSRSARRRFGATVHVLARAISTASGDRSSPSARAPMKRASTSVVPEPQNGSTISAPGRVPCIVTSISTRAVPGCMRAG
jgi:hypothetical protein